MPREQTRQRQSREWCARALVRIGGICIGGSRTREQWLRFEQGYAEAMLLDRSEPGQVGRFSWFTEGAASSEVVIGTVQ
jgi:hypothetical protein